MPSYTDLINYWGQKIAGFKDDGITNNIADFGAYEKANILLIMNILKKIPSPVVFDIGANIGNHTLPLSICAERVYAFEPTKEISDLLTKNVEDNQIKNITIVPRGLSDKDTNRNIHVARNGNIGATSLNELNDPTSDEVVELFRADEFCHESAIEKIDFIKIDVEGHEINVFMGFGKLLEKFRPMVHIEWNPQWWLKQGFSESLILEMFPNYSMFIVKERARKIYKHGTAEKFFHRLRMSILKRVGLYQNYLDKIEKELYNSPAVPLPIRNIAEAPENGNVLMVPNEKTYLLKEYLSVDVFVA